VQDPPHRRRGDVMAEPNQLTLDTPMTPARVLRGHPDHQLSQRPRSAGVPVRAGRCSPICGSPICGPELTMPCQQGCRSHREHRRPALTRKQPRQRSQPQPVDARLPNRTRRRDAARRSRGATPAISRPGPQPSEDHHEGAKQPPNHHIDDNNTRRSSQHPVLASGTVQVSAAI
jgi:hypothetical protein